MRRLLDVEFRPPSKYLLRSRPLLDWSACRGRSPTPRLRDRARSRGARACQVPRRNPSRDPSKASSLRGDDGLDPQTRFERHKYGVKDNQYVRRYGVRLRPICTPSSIPALRGGAAHGDVLARELPQVTAYAGVAEVRVVSAIPRGQ